jgi:hypothetical protein
MSAQVMPVGDSPYRQLDRGQTNVDHAEEKATPTRRMYLEKLE